MSREDTVSGVWMQVRSIGVDRPTRTVGAILARREDGDLLFVPLDRAGAVVVAGARRARSVDPGIALLCSVVASLGARVQHVSMSPERSLDDDHHARVRSAHLVLTDSSTVRCDPAAALAISVHAGVPVCVTGAPATDLLVPAEQGRTRYTAAMTDPVEQSVDELRRLLSHARPADFDLPA